MQGKDELKEKSMASTSASASAAPRSHNPKPPKVREDGELTSSDDDGLLPDPATALTSNSVPNAPSPMRTSLQGINSGKLSSGTISGGSAQFQSQIPYHKGFSKNQVLLKSGNSGWRALGANDNLVIRFSDDDDSGSDAEERKRGKALAFDRPPLALNSNRKPPALPHVKMQTVSKTAKKEGKVMPRKVSSNRTFISSMTKIHESNVRSGATALVNQKSRLKNSNVAIRSLANSEPGCSKNLDMSSSKLEDLRQQIAARENELKLKLVQQNKENVSEGCRDASAMGQRKVSSRKCKSVPVDIQTQPKEPDRKRLKTDAPGVTVSCSLSDWISFPKQTASLMNAAPTDPLERSHPGIIIKNQPSRSAPNQDIHESNMSKLNDHCDATSALKKVKSTSDSSLQARSLQVSNSKAESPDVSPDNTGLLLHLGRSTALTSGDVDLQSLFELEELHDKELEEAQKHRQKCEVEERNALNAYRRAQRALLEANAHCTYLYRKRELYSARFRSFLMEDSSLLYSSGQHHDTEEKWNLANNFSEANLDLIPSKHQLDEAGNRLGYDSNVQSADGDAHNRSSANEDGHNLGSEACSEPDASTSELVRGNNFAANGIRSPSVDPNFSPDDDYETFPLNHRSLHANLTSLTCPRSKDNTKESEKDMDVDSATNLPKDVSQDPLYLEEYLRSKLISRLGVSSVKHSGIGDNSESSAERALEEGVTSAKTQLVVPNVPLSDPNVSAADCRDGPKEAEVSIPNLVSDTQNQQGEEHLLNDSPTPSVNPEEYRLLSVDIASTSIVSASSMYRSVMKAAGPGISDSMHIKEQQYGSPDACTKDNFLSRRNRNKLCSEMTSSAEQLAICADYDRIDSYTFKSVINPFWPLCMYELRGRCNNDECPWQHTKDYSDSDDCQHGLASNCSKGRTGFSCVLTPPRYLVCLDSLKDESRTYGSQACHFGSSGKNIFSHSLAVSSSITKHLPSDEPCLHGNDSGVESFVGSGHPLYFQSRNSTGNLLRKGLADNDQSLELALIVLSQEVNKIEGVKKALSVLSRALEADPSSLPIWIIYLIMYYSIKYSVGERSKESSVEEDDFFSHAVKHSEVSYELWLLYINSRRRLDERFSAYGRALSRLCHYASTKDGQWMHRSAAILDLFLQMLYCFCVSGNFSKAVQRIHRLVYADGDSDESHSLLLSDILQCLTISDKCVFWVCCLYLVIYRKLPDSLVQQFEFEKDVSLIEWPSVHLKVEEKQLVSKLMEKAIHSVGLRAISESHESRALKSAHMLAVNHIKLTAAIDSVGSCKRILEKYQKSYSSCLDIILLSARAYDYIAKSTSLERFEEIVSKWPKNVSGSQCIWNQFAEHALKRGRPDRAKEIMNQWFHSSGLPQLFHNHLVDGEDHDSKSTSADPHPALNWSTLISNYSNLDLVFGLLNLSLYKLFHNDVRAAHSAIDKALKVADAEVLRHCVKEHAAFLLTYGSQLMKDISVHGLIDILKGYIIHARAIPVFEPLTRKFIEDIQKPRTRQLVRNILRPITPDSFLVNLVLEIWFGSSLLPPKFDQLKDMVDFVEAILEVSPANYELVISVCKLVCRDSSDPSNSKSASVLFWASSLLVNTIYHAFPIPPEHVWVEAADLLGKLTSVQEISESFHQRALSAYPFSIKLWKSFLNHSTGASKRSSVVEAAREKGLELE